MTPFPISEPFDTGQLAVQPPHRLRWWQSGAPSGIPILFLHGGPGSRSAAAARGLCDPTRWRIIQFDQRGCGESTPSGELDGNHAEASLADIEELRIQLGIEDWVLFGHSWGSALALGYAQRHGRRCMGLILSAICLGEPADACWFFEGTRALLPEPWEAMMSILPEAQRGNPARAFLRRLTGEDPTAAREAAEAIRNFDRWLLRFMPDRRREGLEENPSGSLAYARIFTHYAASAFFFGEGRLISGIESIRHLPAEIIQGRYDLGVSVLPAYRLHRAWPEAGMTIVPDGAHSAAEPGMRDAIAKAIRRLETLLGA